MKRLLTLCVVALCLGLFSYGCGGGDAPKPPSTPPAAPAQTDEAATEGEAEAATEAAPAPAE